MDNDERRQRGEKLLQQMLGAEQFEWTRQLWHGISPDFENYVVEFLFGDVWKRPHLDLRQRSLVTMATVASLNRPLALELNIRMAIKNGLSREQVIETLLQVAAYAGFPAAWEGLTIAHKVFRDLDQQKDDRVV